MHLPARHALTRRLAEMVLATVLVAIGLPASGLAQGNPMLGPGAGGAESRGAAWTPEAVRPALAAVVRAQRQINATLSREMRSVKEQGSARAALTVAGLAFLYGVLHAVGPGHGKLVVSSYFVNRRARAAAAVLVGTGVSVLQTVTAVLLVGGLGAVLGRRGLDVMAQAARVELLSYALICAIGVALLWVSLRGHGHSHGHAHHDLDGHGGRASLWLIVGAGLTPCASALLILLFALANGVFWLGVATTLVMAIGMSLTLTAVGLLALGARRGAVRLSGRAPRMARWLPRALSVTGALLIALIGATLLAGAWSGAGSPSSAGAFTAPGARPGAGR